MPGNDSPPTNSHTATPSQDRPIASKRNYCEFDTFDYHPDEDVYRAIYSHTDESTSTAVVGAVAAVSDTDPLEMEPLQNSVDTDALNVLTTPRVDAEGDRHVTFTFQGYEVTASSYGSITVRPLYSQQPNCNGSLRSRNGE